MSENQDVGSSDFEDRIRELFADGASDRAVSASGVIHGAGRRRVRHRATAAGSSLAVLGVAAGAIAFSGGHSGAAPGSAPAWVSTTAKHTGTSSTPATTTTGGTAAKTCSASVKGTVPATTSTTLDGLVFGTVSGTTAGIPWAIHIHVFPDKQSHIDWEDSKLPPGSIPQSAKDAEHPGVIAQFRRSGVQGYSEFGKPDSSDKNDFSIQPGAGIGSGTPAKASDPDMRGMPPQFVESQKEYPAYVASGWMAPDVDHLCAEYADHVEFVPVYRIQGGTFYVFAYNNAGLPSKVIGYNSAGKVVGTAISTKTGPYFLSAHD